MLILFYKLYKLYNNLGPNFTKYSFILREGFLCWTLFSVLFMWRLLSKWVEVHIAVSSFYMDFRKAIYILQHCRWKGMVTIYFYSLNLSQIKPKHRLLCSGSRILIRQSVRDAHGKSINSTALKIGLNRFLYRTSGKGKIFIATSSVVCCKKNKWEV